MTFIWLRLAILLLFLALTFFVFTALPHQQPAPPHTGGHLSAFHPVSLERHLPALPVGQGLGQAGKRCHTPCLYVLQEDYCACGKIKLKKVNGVFSTIYSPHWGVRVYCINFGMQPRNI